MFPLNIDTTHTTMRVITTLNIEQFFIKLNWLVIHKFLRFSPYILISNMLIEYTNSHINKNNIMN